MKRKRYPIRYAKSVVMINPDMVDEIAEEIIKNERKQKEAEKRERNRVKMRGIQRGT